MFDLPSKTKNERRIYRRFRKVLLGLGFTKIQFSVYVKFAEQKDHCEIFKRRIKKALPRKGNIRIFTLTDKQYQSMEVFENSQQKTNAPPPPDFIVF